MRSRARSTPSRACFRPPAAAASCGRSVEAEEVGLATCSAPAAAYTAHRSTARRAPVISVGNIAMGGRGKTPVVARIAQWLADAGERPAVLSRGYRRRRPEEGAVIVSDGVDLRADLDRSGDEPLLVARTVPRASVVVCDVRAVAAALAEAHLGATVHVLDDGFQHRSLARDIDIVVVTPEDLRDRRVPFGRLRSPVSALRGADAIVVDGGTADDVAARLATVLDAGTPVFTLHRSIGRPWWLGDGSMPAPTPGTHAPVLAVAGIAAPDRFRASLDRAGWQVAGLIGFPDHHAFTAADLRRVAAEAAAHEAAAVLTTEKDAMRLLPLRPLPVVVAAVPLAVAIEPAGAFERWLAETLARVRA